METVAVLTNMFPLFQSAIKAKLMELGVYVGEYIYSLIVKMDFVTYSYCLICNSVPCDWWKILNLYIRMCVQN
jgi:hypothetical protein